MDRGWSAQRDQPHQGRPLTAAEHPLFLLKDVWSAPRDQLSGGTRGAPVALSGPSLSGFLKLRVIQLCIEAAARKQFFVRTGLHDVAIAQHQDHIGVANG